MPIISRPLKEGGVPTYAAKVALGFQSILAVEADDDFAAILALVNGQLDAANLADLAVTGVKLANNAVTNAKVDAAAGIVGSKLANQPNGITLGKINIGQTIAARNQASVNSPIGMDGTDKDMGQLAITPRGSAVEIFASVHGQVVPSGATGSVQLSIYRMPATLLVVQKVGCQQGPGGVFTAPLSLHATIYELGATPGVPNTYKITVLNVDCTGVILSSVISLLERA